MSSPDIKIAGRVYSRVPEVDRYQIPFDQLGGLLMRHIPANSHLEVLGLEIPDGFEHEVYALNTSDHGKTDGLTAYGGASYWVDKVEQLPKVLERLNRAFGEPGHGFMSSPAYSTHKDGNRFLANVHLSLKYHDSPEITVTEALQPFVEGFERLKNSEIRLFICHASEDKPIARQIASALKELGPEVWFDEWEIRVGESIVEKINAALGSITHLLVLLSNASVEKPWVTRELSSTLMRQLSRERITILPIRLDDCDVPPILADIKYADARDLTNALAEIETALFA